MSGNRDIRRIDFSIAGAQKAGTTALALYLRQIPEIFIPERKETHIFQLSDHVAVNKAVQSIFASAPNAALLCDATPAYLYWPTSATMMAAHNPDMKLVISLRHPALRAYSAWSMETRRGRETLSFSTAIRDGRARVGQAAGGIHKIFSYVERGFYAAQIRRLLEVFPRENLFFLRSDMIKSDHAHMQQLLTFLGCAARSFTPISGNVFPSSMPSGAPAAHDRLNDDLAFLQSLYMSDMQDLPTLTGLDISDWTARAPTLESDGLWA